MVTCPRCAATVPDASRECPQCGLLVDPGTAVTALSVVPGVSRATSPPRSPRTPTTSDGGYTPGTLLADRYRIVGLLGRGGMGEVYRADDLVLGQPVALKFLPPALERDPQRLAQFLSEIRNARQVAHPNVCRVYDVGSIGDQHFYSMEYVDGEDLSSLIRRIGRLPIDKGLEISRQLCAALGAVHDRSLLHRDLKPSNVMLDGRGKVRLTDFGLAAASDGGGAVEGLGGTPAYMAPEQFAGAPATVQSDLYALGVVLYEVFTGQRLFDAPTMAGLRAQQERFHPSDLSTTAINVDPAIERAIGRCLERDPLDRPASAFAVAASLPGGDPLAAALAAGETPSPELVAAAGESRGLSTRAVLLALAIVVAGIGTTLATRTSTGLLARAPLPLSPDVLSNKAEEMLTRLGYPNAPADRAYEFVLNSEYVDYWTKQDKRHGVWPRLSGGEPEIVRFWYRSSPQQLVAQRFRMGGMVSGRVTPNDPPETLPGMISVSLDSRGHLRHLRVVNPRAEDAAPATAAPVAWEALFREAGLDMARFAASPPRWVPPMWGDQRASWRGPAPGLPATTLEVEAASYRGKPTFFTVAGPWSERGEAGKGPTSRRDFVSIAILGAVLLGGVLLARQNIVLGRGDRRGALRLGLAVVALTMAGWAFAASHVPDLSEILLVLAALASALLSGVLVWGAYIALEPHVRRHWPHALISWTRLLTGRLGDPLVGRDVVIGIAAGVVLALVNELQVLIQHRLGAIAPMPVVPRLGALTGLGSALGLIPMVIFDSVFSSLMIFLLLFLVLLVVRRVWLAGTVLVGLIVLNNLANNDFAVSAGLLAALMASGFILLLVRFGLLAFVVGEFVAAMLMSAPLSLDMSAWHWWTTVATLAVIAALSAYGFHAALAGKTLLGAAAATR